MYYRSIAFGLLGAAIGALFLQPVFAAGAAVAAGLFAVADAINKKI